MIADPAPNPGKDSTMNAKRNAALLILAAILASLIGCSVTATTVIDKVPVSVTIRQ